MKWIKIEDATPRMGMDILILFTKDKKQRVDVGCLDSLNKSGEHWRSNQYSFLINNEVTHWMPIPEPPC